MTLTDPHDPHGPTTTLHGTQPGAPADLEGAEIDRELALELEGTPLESTEPPARSQWQLFRRRFLRHRLAVLSLAALAALYALCFGAGLFAPFDKHEQNLALGSMSPSAEHWFGTDELGRDQLTEVLYAGQISLKIGLSVALLSTFIGTVLGSLAGYLGGWVDQLLMRLTDLFLIVPGIAVLAIALQRFGRTDTVIITVLAGLFWMTIARVVRGQVMSIKEMEFVEAARAAGASSTRIVIRHILPNCLGPIVVNATLVISFAIVTESTLSFLGFGVAKPQTSWGNMLADASGYVTSNQHLLYFPGLAILATVLFVNFVGDALRDAFDPHARH
jgi:peptide/nickel transport system permease protein